MLTLFMVADVSDYGSGRKWKKPTGSSRSGPLELPSSTQAVSDAQIPVASLELGQQKANLLSLSETWVETSCNPWKGTNGFWVVPRKGYHPGPGPDTFCLFIPHKKEYQPS